VIKAHDRRFKLTMAVSNRPVHFAPPGFGLTCEVR
jgi:hypothetical protein